MTSSEPAELGATRRLLRATNIRIVAQTFFLSVFLLGLWATWTTRLGGYPVSRFLEIDLLVGVSTALATGRLYRHLAWGLSLLAITLLFGRAFCNWICPFGTLHQFAAWIFNILPLKLRRRSNRYRPLYALKYGLLAGLLILAGFGALQIGLLDPICLLSRSVSASLAPASDMGVDALAGSIEQAGVDANWTNAIRFAPNTERRVFVGSFWIGALLVVLLGMNLVIPRFFCRVLCPLGALLGFLSRFSLFRINRDVKECTDCDACLTRCEGAAEPQSVLRSAECFACMNCIDDCPEDALSYTFLGQDMKQVFTSTDLGRRKLVFSGLFGLLTFPFLKTHGLGTDSNYSPRMIRPPGSVEEGEFLSRCIKCDQCINVCPTNVLQPATTAEGGFEALWTPVMNFNIGHCQLKCNLCGEVCPTGAIRRITVAEKLGKGPHKDAGPIRLGTAFYDLGRCLPHAMEIPCVVCEEVCPVAPKAIRTVDEEIKDVFGKIVVLNKPFIVPDLCIGCGICQNECPVTDAPAVYVTAVGETRSRARGLLLEDRGRAYGS